MGQIKYFAFLSYAHKDAHAAAVLGRFIENFRVPVRLGGTAQNLPRRMFPVFRDREEFSASSDLGAAIHDALSKSGALIVLCSPRAAQSNWVNEEIRTFRQTNNPERIFCVLLEGEPAEALPPALTEGGVEPLAVDFRRGEDDPRDARLRLVAALLGIDFDALKQRDILRVRNERLRIGAPLALWQLLVAFVIFSFQRDEAVQVIFGPSWPLVALFGDVAIGGQLLFAIGLLLPRWPRLSSGLFLAAMISQGLVSLEGWGVFVGQRLAEEDTVFVFLMSISFVLELFAAMFVATLRDWLGERRMLLRPHQGIIVAALVVLFALGCYSAEVAWTSRFQDHLLLSRGDPGSITTGPDGALWFTEHDHDTVGRITTRGRIVEYSLLPSGESPSGIAGGPDGALWFTEYSDKIGRITTSGEKEEFRLPSHSGPENIASGPDGALWFTSYFGIGRISTTGKITTYPFIRGADWGGIASGVDGALWFTIRNFNEIGRITTNGKITEYRLPELSSPSGIASGSDGALWFTEDDKIGRITTNGNVTEYSLPRQSNPLQIASGSDGALWFTEGGVDKIGRITTSGSVTHYSLPGSRERSQGLHLWGIASGPDGALWFTENSRIERL